MPKSKLWTIVGILSLVWLGGPLAQILRAQGATVLGRDLLQT